MMQTRNIASLSNDDLIIKLEEQGEKLIKGGNEEAGWSVPLPCVPDFDDDDPPPANGMTDH